MPRGLRTAAGNGAEQRRRAEGDTADHQVHAGTCRGTCGHAAADLHAELLQGLGIEQIVAPAPIEQREIAGCRVVPAKGVQAQQRLDAALLAAAHGVVQFPNGATLQFRLGRHAASAGGDIHQQFGDQSLATGQACGSLGLVVLDQALQLGARLFQQQRQAFIQPALTVHGWRHAVEAHQCMQAEAGQGLTPFLVAVPRLGDEVEHRQQRLAAAGEHRQLVLVLGQHRLTGVDHVEPGVAGEQLTQHLGFLLEAPPRLAAVEKARGACRAVEAFAGALQSLEVVEQGDGIFETRGVVELQQRFAIHRQPCAFDVTRGARPVRDLAEADVAGQGAQ